MEININTLLENYQSKYLLGKENMKTNKDNALNYLKSSLTILNEIKKQPKEILNKYEEIIIKTETETFELLNICLEHNIETEEITYKDNIDYKKIFKSIEKGNLEEIKKYNFQQINFKKLYKNQTLLHHAIKFGDTLFLKYCFKLGARIDTPNGFGNNLLEYACLEKDQNVINFLLKNGANMKKNLYFRNSPIKNFNFNDSIDISNLCKLIIDLRRPDEFSENSLINKKINDIKKYLNLTELIGFNNFTYGELLNNIEYLLNKTNIEDAITYLDILEEEIKYKIKNKLGCPNNKLEIILVNLKPFINYPFNFEIDWLLSLELKYLILKNLKNNKLNDINEIKKNIVDELWEKYIKTNIVEEDYIGNLIYQWMTKIKV
jgi:hypothetical protein